MPPAPAWYQLVRGCRRAAAGHKFVAVRVSEDVPAPPVFDHGVIGEQGRAQAGNPLDLPFQAGGAQVQMQPVLVVLVIAGALQEHLDAAAVAESAKLLAEPASADPAAYRTVQRGPRSSGHVGRASCRLG